MQEENTTSPHVSVVVTTRNRLHWLKQCVNSVQSQQGVSWELIIIDDASNDETWDWLREKNNRSLQIHHLAINPDVFQKSL